MQKISDVKAQRVSALLPCHKGTGELKVRMGTRSEFFKFEACDDGTVLNYEPSASTQAKKAYPHLDKTAALQNLRCFLQCCHCILQEAFLTMEGARSLFMRSCRGL